MVFRYFTFIFTNIANIIVSIIKYVSGNIFLFIAALAIMPVICSI